MKYLIIFILALLPFFAQAQLLRAYGVVEIGSTFPTSSVTGAKFAYRTTDSSFYRWIHTNVWVKVVEPSIIPDTLYLTQISGTTAIVNGDTIDLTPYVLKVDTASMLAPYIRLAGYGIIKTGQIIRADTTSPNGLATRLFAKTLPTVIAANYLATSNGTNLVARNLFDNNTYVGVLNSKPFSLGQWTTAGRPSGVTAYTGFNTTLGGQDWYDGTRWNLVPKADRSAFTDTYVPFTNSSGQLTQASATGQNLRYYNAGSNLHILEVSSAIEAKGVAGVNLGNADIVVSSATNVGRWSFSTAESTGAFSFYDAISAQTPVTIAKNSGNARISTNSTTTALSAVSLLTGTVGSTVQTIGNATDALGGTGTWRIVNGSNIFSITPTSTSPYFAITNGTQRGYFQATTLDGIRIGSSTAHPFIFLTNATARAYISATGDFAIGNSSPQRKFHVTGEARISDLTTDTPTQIVGADADGDLGALAISGGLSISSGTLSSTWLKPALEAGNVTISNNSNTLTLTGSSFTMQNQGGFNNFTIAGNTDYEGTITQSQKTFTYFTQLDKGNAFLPGHYRLKHQIVQSVLGGGDHIINVTSVDTTSGLVQNFQGSFFGGEDFTQQFSVSSDVSGVPGFKILKIDSGTTGNLFEVQSTSGTTFLNSVRADGLLGLSRYTDSAPFTPNAIGEEASELFLTTSATTGKVLQRKMRETTWTNTSGSVTDDMLELAQDVFVYANCPAIATDSTVIDLPTPSVDYIGQVVEVCGDGRNATPNYQVYVRGVGATLWHQAGGADPSAQTYLEVTNLSSNHNTVKFICAQPSGSTYYWILLKQQ